MRRHPLNYTLTSDEIKKLTPLKLWWDGEEAERASIRMIGAVSLLTNRVNIYSACVEAGNQRIRIEMRDQVNGLYTTSDDGIRCLLLSQAENDKTDYWSAILSKIVPNKGD